MTHKVGSVSEKIGNIIFAILLMGFAYFGLYYNDVHESIKVLIPILAFLAGVVFYKDKLGENK